MCLNHSNGSVNSLPALVASDLTLLYTARSPTSGCTFLLHAEHRNWSGEYTSYSVDRENSSPQAHLKSILFGPPPIGSEYSNTPSMKDGVLSAVRSLTYGHHLLWVPRQTR